MPRRLIFSGGNKIKSESTKLTIDAIRLSIPLLPVYSDNNSAIEAGLPIGSVYKNSDGQLRIVVQIEVPA